MANHVYSQIKSAFQNLNPRDVRALAERPLNIGIIASGEESFREIAGALLSPPATRARRRQVLNAVHRTSASQAARHDLVLCEADLLCPPEAFVFSGYEPQKTIAEILEQREDLSLALARSFGPFRKPVVNRIIRTISRENALFALVSAVPNVIPSFIQLPWAVGEFASDTAFLTMNQVRMAFLIAAASDREVGYRHQRAQIATIVGGAVGWRAIARELVGKVPFGGGLVPKAAIAFAGTYTVGLGLERFFRIGYGMTRAERKEAYEDAFERGKKLVRSIVESAKEIRQSAYRA